MHRPPCSFGVAEGVVTAIHIYPIKSLRGIALPECAIHALGFAGDRRWMIVDDRGHFLTQRQLPKMALVGVALRPDGLLLTSSEGGAIPVSLPVTGAVQRPVEVWGRTIMASDADPAVSRWLGERLARPCSLVYLPEPIVGTPRNGQVGFSDSFPFLLIGEASLTDLNVRLERKGVASLPMNRFRPNLVVAGLDAYAEDRWRDLTIGGVRFRVAKPCERCVVTTTDQQTGARDPLKEPLATLREYRGDAAGNALFGQNLIHEGVGHIRIGDPVLGRVEQ